MTQPGPDDFAPVGDDGGLQRDLEPRRFWKVAPVTAVLAGVVLLAAGATGGVVAHAALAGDSAPAAGDGQRGAYPGRGFGGTGNGPAQGGDGAVTVGTVESVSGTTLKVKTQDGSTVTVTLAPDTDIQVTKKGAATDLTTGSTVAVTGTDSNGTVTARTVRQGDVFGGRRPTATPSSR